MSHTSNIVSDTRKYRPDDEFQADTSGTGNQSIQSTCWTPSQVRVAAYINLSLNIATDLVFALIIPLSMLWNINVTFRTKVTLFFILGLGCFVCACAIVRITFLRTYGSNGDWTWDTVDLAEWTVIELNVAIIAGSLPSLRPLVKKFLGSVYGSGSQRKAFSIGGVTSLARSRVSKRWCNLPPNGVGNTGAKGNHYVIPSYPASRARDDVSDQERLHDPQWIPTSPDNKEGFELYMVEAHVTCGTRPNLPPDGITKTTHTTVTYGSPQSA